MKYAIKKIVQTADLYDLQREIDDSPSKLTICLVKLTICRPEKEQKKR